MGRGRTYKPYCLVNRARGSNADFIKTDTFLRIHSPTATNENLRRKDIFFTAQAVFSPMEIMTSTWVGKLPYHCLWNTRHTISF